MYEYVKGFGVRIIRLAEREIMYTSFEL